MPLCFLQPNQITHDVACWHNEWLGLQHRFMPDECHRGMTSVEGKDSLTEHLRAASLCWFDCNQLCSFFLALVLLTHGLLVRRKVILFLGRSALSLILYSLLSPAPCLTLRWKAKFFRFLVSPSVDRQICNAKTERFKLFEPKGKNSSSVSSSWHLLSF